MMNWGIIYKIILHFISILFLKKKKRNGYLRENDLENLIND